MSIFFAILVRIASYGPQIDQSHGENRLSHIIMDYISNLSGRSWVKIETVWVITNQKLSIRNLRGKDFICQKRTNIRKEIIKLCSYLSRIWVWTRIIFHVIETLLRFLLEDNLFYDWPCFLKSELTESSLSWKKFFLASLKRKLYLLRYLLYLNLLSAVGFNWNCL